MNRVARFEKVSFEQFEVAMKEEFGFRWTDDELKEMYFALGTPRRATTGSAGYDFFAPFDFVLKPNQSIKIPTGIRCVIDNGWWLGILPRSGQGSKFILRLACTEGVVDSDYVNSDNEGHIYIKLVNETNERKVLKVKVGDGIAQGLLQVYGLDYDDDATGVRNGGFGSTSKPTENSSQKNGNT